MKTTIYKWFWVWDFDKEEQWLNHMAEKGLHLIDIGWCRYLFEEGIPGEYTVRLELLNNAPTHDKSRQYIRFIEGTDAEYIGSVMRWVYFRKKSEQGSFNLYSDIDSRIHHLNRILILLVSVLCLEIPIGLANIVMYLQNLSRTTNLYCALLIASVITLIGIGIIKVKKKKTILLRDRLLFES